MVGRPAGEGNTMVDKDQAFGLPAEDQSVEDTVNFEPVTTHGMTIPKPIVLIGMMGAGKSAIGRMIAQKLNLPFVDADHEIEAAAALTIPEIFEKYGEDHFRYGERRVIARLLRDGVQILATGGGAYMSAETRETIHKHAICIWFRAEFDILWERVSRKSHRPLLHTPDPQGTLKSLIETRYPVYEEADIIIDCDDVSKEEMRERVIEELRNYLNNQS